MIKIENRVASEPPVFLVFVEKMKNFERIFKMENFEGMSNIKSVIMRQVCVPLLEGLSLMFKKIYNRLIVGRLLCT